MIIDCHAHMAVPRQLPIFRNNLLAHRGAHGLKCPTVSDDDIHAAFTRVEMAPFGHLECLDRAGVDMQMLSPRPFQSMHSEEPKKLVHAYISAVNDILAREVALYPKRFAGVGSLPQTGDSPIEDVLGEFERCVSELGFKGFLVNPDPFENGGRTAAPMGDRYWYPLYEKFVEHDVVMHIHSTASRLPEREPYSLHFINEETTAVFGLCKSSVMQDFPALKVLVSHGGGAIPYQYARFDATTVPRGDMTRAQTRFSENMRRLHYDTVLYSAEAIRLLIKTVGASQVLYGAEMPGIGSSINPDTGDTFDNIPPWINGLDFISEEERQAIFSGNAFELFNLDL